LNESIAPPPLFTSSSVAFLGRRSEFRRLVMRGAALELVTVGFYRFWLATDMRRHLWSNTAIERDPLEYTGLAKELLIGFLFALAILVPVYLIYFIIGLEAERLQAFASVPLVLFFYLFTQFAIYRARRYRLTRTVWRGVRFWMRGSGWAYAFRAGAWSLWAIVTLGLALPWRQAALERYKMRHTFYGSLPAHFAGTGAELFKRVWWLWLLTVLGLISQIGFSLSPITMFLGAAISVAYPCLYATFKAIEWRWWVSGIRFGEVHFESNLRKSALIALYWKVIGWTFLLVAGLSAGIGVLFGAIAALGAGAGTAQQTVAVMQHPLFLVAVGLIYLVTLLAVGVVWRIYLIRDVWARVVESATVFNLAAADNVAAQGELVSGLGEGFADGLDIAGF
jgi:uncharacterized membrane protein YjgN (DUF898 family)